MNEDASASGGALTGATRRLTDVRRALLRLHKVLLDGERANYERVYDQVTGGEMPRLVINHEQFAWLRPLCELIVRVDEMLNAVEPATVHDAESLLADARSLLKPSEGCEGFRQKYFAAIQRSPP